MRRWAAFAALLLVACVACLSSAASVGDVSEYTNDVVGDGDLAAEPEENGSNELEPNAAGLTSVDPSGGAGAAGDLSVPLARVPRVKRSPAEDDQAPEKRRRRGRKGRRRSGGGRRRSGGRRRKLRRKKKPAAPTQVEEASTPPPRPAQEEEPTEDDEDDEEPDDEDDEERDDGADDEDASGPTEPERQEAPVAPRGGRQGNSVEQERYQPYPPGRRGEGSSFSVYSSVPPGTINDRPVIGVLSQELSKSLHDLFPDEGFTSYIAASYVKFLEAAGARVVPVMIGQSDHYYREMYRYLNGILFPGGGADLETSGYGRAAKAIWSIAAENPQDYFPIIGICLGFELITYLELNDRRLSNCSAENQAVPLQFTPDGLRSRMFGDAPDQLRRVFASESVTVNFHKHCLAPATFQTTPLSSTYKMLALNRDLNGAPYVSAFEHNSRPIYGTQFHPEKNIFEWGQKTSISNIPHSANAIAASQYLANFFVSEARKSLHRFPSVELETDYLIFNYEPDFTGVMGSSFTAVYFFA